MINNLIKTTTLAALATVALSANNIQFSPVTDIESVVKKIEKSNLKKPRRTKRSYSVDHVSNFTYDQTRDTIDTISDDKGPLFYLVRNKVQHDSSIQKPFNKNKLKARGYNCKNNPNCTGKEFYTEKVFDNISIGANIVLDQNPNEEIVFFERNYKTSPDYPLASGGPFLKVFIDKDRYLNAKYILQTGGTTQARTDKPIPLGEKVYFQANKLATLYEVGWKSFDTNEESIGKSSMPLGIPYWTNELSELYINDNLLKPYIKKYNMRDFYFDVGVSMFGNFDKSDISSSIVYQDDSLVVDESLVNRILQDLRGERNYFNQESLKVYVNDNQDIIAVDIREHR